MMQLVIKSRLSTCVQHVLFKFSVTTTTSIYEKHCYKISAVLSIILCCVSLLTTSSLAIHPDSPEPHNDMTSSTSIPRIAISPAGLYAIYVELLLLMYTVVPLPLLGTLLIGIAYR